MREGYPAPWCVGEAEQALCRISGRKEGEAAHFWLLRREEGRFKSMEVSWGKQCAQGTLCMRKALRGPRSFWSSVSSSFKVEIRTTLDMGI